MDKLVKLAIVVGVLLAGVGVFYHFVIYLPDLDRKKEEHLAQEKREAEFQKEQLRLEAANREQTRQTTYTACLQGARANYELNWATACKTAAASQVSRLRSCLADNLIVTNPYMGKNYCYNTFGGGNESPNCSLPKSTAEGVNKTYKEEQDRCLAESKSGL